MKLKTLPTFGRYLKAKFGAKVAKIPVGLSGFTCPNIDGTVAKGGCTFCLNESFSPNLAKDAKILLNIQSKTNPLLEQQLRELDLQILTTQKTLKQQGVKKFLVYFQAFTNTYAPFETLKTLYDKALSYPDVIGLSIGTRSDSVTDEVLDYLAQLSKTKEIWIEFGVQSVFDETLEKINRGHDAANAKEAILKAKTKGLNVCAHLIFGLPGENQEMMLTTAREVYNWGVDAVKYHPLYVVKNTLLANQYKAGEFIPITKEEYAAVLIKALEIKPPHILIQRMTAGISDDTLLAPEWCGWSKNAMVAYLNKTLYQAGWKI
ncbi:MAG: TIGR01212 family radical SAM protein [Campylobacterales bacterium]|nr:TIGR01212 family radical SAM protein [Campylobacterales bacterium]